LSTLLDTNVVSELLRPTPSPAVLAWFSLQPAESLWTSAVTKAEMLLGVRLLVPGRRRSALEAAVDGLFAEDFAGRILPFDADTADGYADIVASRRARGRPIPQFDAQIAAIARRARFRLATRNTGDFEHCGLTLVDPWVFRA
jgi:predicted nucleic acid-binding protein